MQLILVSKHRGHLAQLRLSSGRACTALAALAVVVCASSFFAGFRSASVFGVANPQIQVEQWRAELKSQEEAVAATRRALQQNIDALALRIGQMNAHVVRLDALGSRLTQMADLEDGEFDFSSQPSLGGPEEPAADGEATEVASVVTALDALDVQLADRDAQLSVLEDFLLNRKLRDEVHPEGRPVTAGYVSSRFGHRTDPLDRKSTRLNSSH